MTLCDYIEPIQEKKNEVYKANSEKKRQQKAQVGSRNKAQNQKKQWVTPSHKADVNGFSKTMNSGFGATVAKGGFGFGQYRG
jgi:hypothetical protein